MFEAYAQLATRKVELINFFRFNTSIHDLSDRKLPKKWQKLYKKFNNLSLWMELLNTDISELIFDPELNVQNETELSIVASAQVRQIMFLERGEFDFDSDKTSEIYQNAKRRSILYLETYRVLTRQNGTSPSWRSLCKIVESDAFAQK